MSIWMKKSIAKVLIKDRAEPIVLDDYEYADVYLIVGALASKFHPDAWTEEAKPVKEDEADEDDDGSAESELEAEPTEEDSSEKSKD